MSNFWGQNRHYMFFGHFSLPYLDENEQRKMHKYFLQKWFNMLLLNMSNSLVLIKMLQNVKCIQN